MTMLTSWLGRHWRLGALLLCGVAPFLPSISAMGAFLLADNALGFLPFILPAAAYLFWVRAHTEVAPHSRDVLLDCFFAVPAIVLALFILLLTPARLSWYFWLYRLDLLAFALTVCAAGFVFLGYQQVIRAWQGFALLFLAWPYPVVRLQQLVSEPMTEAVVWVSRQASAFLALPYSIEGATFTSTHLGADGNFAIVLGQACSGSAITIGMLLTGTVMACLVRGPFAAKLWWVALGVALGYLVNLLRIVVLLTVAARANFDLAMDVVHPVLGLAFFGLLVLGMLLLLPAFGLRLDARARGTHLAWEPVVGGGRPLRALWVTAVVFAAITGATVMQLQRYSFIGVGEGAPAIGAASERAILPGVQGWDLSHRRQIAWPDLFGNRVRGDLFLYRYSGGPGVIAQVVVADTRDAIDRYSIEDCLLLHQAEIDSIRYVTLPYGVTGVLIHDDYGGVPASTLYWHQPVYVGGETRHARIALLLDIEEPAKQVDVSALPTGTFIDRFGALVTTTLDGKAPRGPDVRDNVDLVLAELASRMLEAMVGVIESGR